VDAVAKRLILAHHAIFGAYGFWLPNDQRGSWSTEVWAPHLQPFGPATKTTERKSLARRPFDRTLRKEARAALLYRAVELNEAQRDAVALGFAHIIPTIDLHLLACAIMPDHVHLVTLNHRASIEQIVGYLKRAGTRKLNELDLHPLREFRKRDGSIPTPWVEHGWNRFVDEPRAVDDAIDYVNRNPMKIGLPRQKWSFVERFENHLPRH
jgi:REP element-mobilizing transposase RayT